MTTKHAALKKWVKDCADLCQPDKIVWLNGSEQEKKKLEREAVKAGELIALNPKKHPNSFYHRSDPSDVSRTEHLTFVCTHVQDDAGPNNNWMPPKEAYAKAGKTFHACMKGRTMYVIPFSMGPLDSPYSKIGVQLTDSLYVVLNMRIMTIMGDAVLEKLGTQGEFVKCLHSKADLSVKRRLILHFPEDKTIWSVGSGYGGNALLGKKCLALRIASHMGQKEGWLAEHMLIMGIQDPQGHVTHIAAAFPSACGKTNLAMLVPPHHFEQKGYKIWTIGDDIAWLRIDEKGELRAMNPEAGFFGVAPGTNSKTNPNAMASLHKNSIFTNVLLKKDKTVWWEGGDGPAPESGLDWRGKAWKPGMLDKNGKPLTGAHPNSRFTAPINQCPSLSKDYYSAEGVKISAIVFGARRATLAPLVYQARSWQHGVFVGATMASERTAAQVGAVGEVRWDPMAMLPFCGINMATYFQHWLDMGKRMTNPPRIFRVNWFRKDETGKFLWPGYGENLRILLWMIDRCRYQVSAKETPYGYIPFKEDVDLTGLDVADTTWNQLFSFTPDEWLAELDAQKPLMAQFGDRLPQSIRTEDQALRARLEEARTVSLATAK